jgi:lactate permease
VLRAWLPFIVLVIVVVLWTGPWSGVPKYIPFKISVAAGSSIEAGKTVSAAFNWAPGIGGTAILVSWIIVAFLVGLTGAQLREVFRRTWHQMWGACLVGVFIFGLAFVFNYSGMANSLASGFSKIGVWFIVVAPVLGWIGVALSGSNTSTNAMFGAFQASVGRLLGFPLLLLPSLNSVGAEVGKPVAPQTASVGVSTSRFVRNEGAVIRHNMGWTFVLLIYLVVIGVAFYYFAPGVLILH